MTIRVLFFSVLRDLTGVEELDLTLEAPEASVGDAIPALLKRFPELENWSGRWLIAVNCEYAGLEESLSDGAELALFPPVQGG